MVLLCTITGLGLKGSKGSYRYLYRILAGTPGNVGKWSPLTMPRYVRIGYMRVTVTKLNDEEHNIKITGVINTPLELDSQTLINLAAHALKTNTLEFEVPEEYIRREFSVEVKGVW